MTTVGPLISAPLIEPRPRRERMRAPLLTIGGLGLLSVALHFRDPHQQASWGLCPSAVLGFWCPGCGGLRAVNDLGHGQISAAFSSNFAFMVLLPFLVGVIGVWTVDQWRGTRTRLPPVLKHVVTGVVLVFVVAFTIFRNTPAGAWFAP